MVLLFVCTATAVRRTAVHLEEMRENQATSVSVASYGLYTLCKVRDSNKRESNPSISRTKHYIVIHTSYLALIGASDLACPSSAVACMCGMCANARCGERDIVSIVCRVWFCLAYSGVLRFGPMPEFGIKTTKIHTARCALADTHVPTARILL